jgi:hypothetical protein
MEQDAASAPTIWRGWTEIERHTDLSANTLRKLAKGGGLPVFKLGGEACLLPSAWSGFVRRLAGEG